MGSSDCVNPTITLPSRTLKSSKSELNAKIAIISEAVTISKPVSLTGKLFVPPIPVTICLRERCSMSVTRRKDIPLAVNPGICFLWAAFSVSATRRLCADPTACASPVK